MAQADQDRRIDYLEFGSTDLDRVKAFYGSVFGWEFTDYGPNYAAFSDGRLNGGFTTETPVKHGGALVVTYSLDLEATAATVREHGGKIVKEIFSFPGGRRFHFTDPDGHELAVWSEG
jgi:predicted enzyme related to lactoylglutathione lyase